MYRCHICTERLVSDSIVLDREESHHLKSVLRVQPGVDVQLFDGAGHTRDATITTVEKNSILLKPAEETLFHPVPKCAIALFVCISKGKRMDWTVEKAVGLGVSTIIPVISDRTIVRLSESERKSKKERWTRIAIDALRQCGGNWIPEIYTPLDFSAAMSSIPESRPVFTAALTEDAVLMLESLRRFTEVPSSAGWFVGPEGDFTPDEISQLRNAGTKFVSLGKNVLRAETASIYGLCVLGYEWL